ncbi:protease-like protein [Cricetulus griseus]|nr:protease-like protein [Cricetulus griseus]
MNVDRPGTYKEIHEGRKPRGGPQEGPYIEKGRVNTNSSGRQSLTGPIDSSLPIVKNDTAVDGSLNSDKESSVNGQNEKRIFWQASINDKRPQLKVKINNEVISGLVDTGADVTIITQKSWPQKWPLREANVQFLGIGTLSRVRQSVNSVVYIGPEGQKGILKPYVADIAINLWGHDLLQQWNTQINIPPMSDTNYVQSLDSRKDLVRRYGKRLPIIHAAQKLGTNDGPSDTVGEEASNHYYQFTDKEIKTHRGKKRPAGLRATKTLPMVISKYFASESSNLQAATTVVWTVESTKLDNITQGLKHSTMECFTPFQIKYLVILPPCKHPVLKQPVSLSAYIPCFKKFYFNMEGYDLGGNCYITRSSETPKVLLKEGRQR